MKNITVIIVVAALGIFCLLARFNVIGIYSFHYGNGYYYKSNILSGSVQSCFMSIAGKDLFADEPQPDRIVADCYLINEKE